MSEPQRVPDPDEAPRPDAPPHVDTPELTSHHASQKYQALDDLSVAELRARARERAEADAAVGAVMRREEVKADLRAQLEGRRRQKPKPVRLVLLAALVLGNGYLWMGSPNWLTWHEPALRSMDFYQSSYKISVYLQRQRIEEYRKLMKQLPTAAKQAGPPVRGVKYSWLAADRYMLEAGRGLRIVFYSSSDSIAVFMGRTLVQMGLIAKGSR